MANTSDKNRQYHVTGHFSVSMFYEDTDLSGFVYHANYLKFFERAREELVGIEYLKDCQKHGVHFVVARADLQYRKPAVHGDQLSIESQLTFSRSPVSSYVQRAWRGDEMLVEGQIRIAALSLDNRPVRLSDPVFDHLVSLTH